jgi:hypothetical protein
MRALWCRLEANSVASESAGVPGPVNTVKAVEIISRDKGA